MNSNFSPLPQSEFPQHVSNRFLFNITCGCMVYLSFIFMTAVVHNITPSVFMFSPYILGAFGTFCLVLTHYSKCTSILLGVYLFCLSYDLAYFVDSMHLEWATVSTLLGIFLVSACLCLMTEKKIPFVVMGSLSTVFGVTCNTLCIFLYDNASVVLVCSLSVGIVIYNVIVFYYMSNALCMYTPTQFVDALMYISMAPKHLLLNIPKRIWT